MAQSIVKSLAIRSLALVALCATLFSFSEEKIGGESFTVYLNDKLLVKQYVHADKTIHSFSLAESAVTDVLNVNYSHCGKIGTARSITIKDPQSKSLKQWAFPDAGAENAGPTMAIKVKEVLALQKNSKEGKQLHLIYTSRELPEGRILAAITLTNDTKASLK